jgi:hypothetical protein
VIRAIFVWLVVPAAALLPVTACQRSAASTPPQVALVSTGATGSGAHIVQVSSLSSSDLRALERTVNTPDEWQRLLRVSVKSTGADGPIAIAGKYAVRDDALTFTPLFPFDPGREYLVSLDLSALGRRNSDGSRTPIVATVALPAAPPAPPTFVTEVYPSGDTIPENQLRFYIHFSAPMGRGSGLDHIRLLDDRGAEVQDPFLPVDADLWNGDRTRFTVFFDPGRQKRGILPNREMGRSLVAGRSYTLVVNRAWIDGHSQPLRDTYTRKFRVVPADLAPVNYSKWTVTPPVDGTRDPLSVRFPEPLDHGLLLRAIGVRREDQPLAGEVRVDEHEAHWTMTPNAPWTAGRYELVALPILEDLAGNRIGRAFEIISLKRPDDPSDQKISRIPFEIARKF